MTDIYDLIASSYVGPQPSPSTIVNTVYGPAYTPYVTSGPGYDDWTVPYTPAAGFGPEETGYWGGTYYGAGDYVPTSSSIYGGSSGYSTGGGGSAALGANLPIWDPYNALMQLLPSPSATPQEQYSYYTAPQIKALGEKIAPIVYADQGRSGAFPGWEEIRDQAQRLVGTSEAWAPGSPGIGARRTLAQQAEYEKAMEPLWNYVMPLPPITGLFSDELAEVQRRQQYGQQAWDLWKPALQQLLGPETMKGGSPDWLRSASGLTGAAPYRPAPPRTSSSGSSWSFAPRWG